jgi:hypothetical protein
VVKCLVLATVCHVLFLPVSVLCAIFIILPVKQKKSVHVTSPCCICCGMVLVRVPHPFQLLNQWNDSDPQHCMLLKLTQCNFEFAAISNNYLAETQSCELGGWVCEFHLGKTQMTTFRRMQSKLTGIWTVLMPECLVLVPLEGCGEKQIIECRFSCMDVLVGSKIFYLSF